MNTLHLLVSGDYWHDDFRDQLSIIKHPTTMVPAARIESLADHNFDLVVLAKSGRYEVEQSTVDAIRRIMPKVPIVVLLGSWCEGENRSGQRLEGTTSVLWHQWETKFEKFCSQFGEEQATDWHLPLTATVADRVRDFSPSANLLEKLSGSTVGISSNEKHSAESIRDLLAAYKCQSKWIRSGDIENGEGASGIDVLCIDASQGVGELTPRLAQLSAKFTDIPSVVVAGFVRQQDIDMLSKLGINHVIAKPFDAEDFAQALVNALAGRKETMLPKPSMLKSSKQGRQARRL